MDVLNLWGRTRDLTVAGMGQSTLEDTLSELAKARGRSVLPDQEPEKGHYYRSDHFEFAKVGVPAISYGGGYDYIGRPAGWGMKKHQDFVAHDYHKPTDEVKTRLGPLGRRGGSALADGARIYRRAVARLS